MHLPNLFLQKLQNREQTEQQTVSTYILSHLDVDKKLLWGLPMFFPCYFQFWLFHFTTFWCHFWGESEFQNTFWGQVIFCFLSMAKFGLYQAVLHLLRWFPAITLLLPTYNFSCFVGNELAINATTFCKLQDYSTKKMLRSRKYDLNKIGLLLCHNWLKLVLRLSWAWYWGESWFEAEVELRLTSRLRLRLRWGWV